MKLICYYRQNTEKIKLEKQNLRDKAKDKLDVKNSETTLNPHAEHLCRCSNLTEPYFSCYSVYYTNEKI